MRVCTRVQTSLAASQGCTTCCTVCNKAGLFPFTTSTVTFDHDCIVSNSHFDPNYSIRTGRSSSPQQERTSVVVRNIASSGRNLAFASAIPEIWAAQRRTAPCLKKVRHRESACLRKCVSAKTLLLGPKCFMKAFTAHRFTITLTKRWVSTEISFNTCACEKVGVSIPVVDAAPPCGWRAVRLSEKEKTIVVASNQISKRSHGTGYAWPTGPASWCEAAEHGGPSEHGGPGRAACPRVNAE